MSGLTVEAQDRVDDAFLAVVDWVGDVVDGRPLSRPPHPERLCARADGPKVLPFEPVQATD